MLSNAFEEFLTKLLQGEEHDGWCWTWCRSRCWPIGCFKIRDTDFQQSYDATNYMIICKYQILRLELLLNIQRLTHHCVPIKISPFFLILLHGTRRIRFLYIQLAPSSFKHPGTGFQVVVGDVGFVALFPQALFSLPFLTHSTLNRAVSHSFDSDFEMTLAGPSRRPTVGMVSSLVHFPRW